MKTTINTKEAAMCQMMQTLENIDNAGFSELIRPLNLIQISTGVRFNTAKGLRICKAVLSKSILFN